MKMLISGSSVWWRRIRDRRPRWARKAMARNSALFHTWYENAPDGHRRLVIADKATGRKSYWPADGDTYN